MKLGIIGYGRRIAGFTEILRELDSAVEIVAIADINQVQVRALLREKNVAEANIQFYSDADKMLDCERLDGVLIGTRCSLHAEMAVKVLRRNLPLFLEKPVATNMADLLRLKAAWEASQSRAVVSFPLRVTPLAKLVKEILDSGRLGTIEHVQAVNNVPYGGIYFHNWYRDEGETGGLWLQKATHDFDCINYLLGRTPEMICAMQSKQIFHGDHPAGLECSACPEQKTCPEGPFLMKLKLEDPNGPYCCFAEDTGNEDSGSAIIRYDGGMHAVYSQNFFARKEAAKRGARLLGYNGTLEFDWRTSVVKVMMHNAPQVETYQIDTAQMAHNGGDQALAINFLDVVSNGAESVSPMEAGLLSVLMCLKARKSCEENTFESIAFERG